MRWRHARRRGGVLLGSPAVRGRGSWLGVVLAKRAKQRGIYAGSTNGWVGAGPGAPRQRPGRIWQLERQQPCLRAVGVSGASGARRIVAALPGPVGGGRGEEVAVAPVGLKAGVGSSGVLGLLVPRRSLIPGRLPGLRGL